MTSILIEQATHGAHKLSPRTLENERMLLHLMEFKQESRIYFGYFKQEEIFIQGSIAELVMEGSHPHIKCWGVYGSPQNSSWYRLRITQIQDCQPNLK